MVLMPRFLYGLHELFLLVPYERGAKRARLVLRASRLKTFLEAHPTGFDYPPEACGAPLVLGEIAHMPGTNTAAMLMTGRMLQTLRYPAENGYYQGLTWHFRFHRASWTIGGAGVRFETGTRLVYGTVTAYFTPMKLLSLLEEGYAANRKTHTS